MYTEIAKIIEGGLQKDPSKVMSYAELLAQKCEKSGDTKLATKIRKILSGDKEYKFAIKEHFFNLPVDNETRLSIADLIVPEINSNDLVFNISVREAVNDFVEMITHKEVLADAGFNMSCSLLLYGPPGCGKTSLAQSIAKQLDLPILIARLDSMISSLLGNTSKNLRKLFEYANTKPCILFLDEFDAIAKNRKDQNEQGELKRVINSLLQNIDEYLEAGNILIAATNHEELLDDAIWRRFEKIISVDKPGSNEAISLITSVIEKSKNELSTSEIEKIAAICEGLSYSEIKKIITSSITKSIIKDKEHLQYIDVIYGYYQYAHFNDYSEEALVKYLSENGISQKDISEFFNISVRQVRNKLK
ncbi:MULTISPECIES: AAA family ATPase [Bacteroidales]|jgi:AAA+ superfamily predicted ATPase|uniref:AAA family ATPase n=1 Tax=Bacteroidales TaxID=171549 RepID=UPI000EFEF60E|nr:MULTISPECIES: ATP-binding protein [Bacteroidales]RHR83426.1 ATP-binding protein [Bacteroides sp. AF16-49]